MNKYNPNKHNRRSIRLRGYDYSQAGLYFITICCKNRAHLFGEVQNGEMALNTFGKIAFEEWLATEKIRDNCRIHQSIIMPNHLHGIIEITFQKKNYKGEREEEDKLKKKEGLSTDELKEGLSTGELQFAPTAPTEKFKSPSQTIGSIIRGFKIATIKKIKEEILNNMSELKKELSSTGELQFAPTAPTVDIIKNLDFKIWQRNYYEHIIRNEKAYHRIAEYIINNPKKWREDKLY